MKISQEWTLQERLDLAVLIADKLVMECGKGARRVGELADLINRLNQPASFLNENRLVYHEFIKS